MIRSFCIKPLLGIPWKGQGQCKSGVVAHFAVNLSENEELLPPAGEGISSTLLRGVYFFLSAFLLASSAQAASLSGVDDVNPNIPAATQARIDDAVMTYYRHPAVEKVDTVLDIMSDSKLMQKKTAWAPMIGFLTVVFADHKDQVMRWISRNDYNDYAIDAIVSALMHAKLKETALVFAQAEQWKGEQLELLRATNDTTDLKHLAVVVPGHIDTLWGAFFASGDPVYVNEIIDVLFMTALSPAAEEAQSDGITGALDENKKLAQYTLKEYAALHEVVRKAISRRIGAEKTPARKKLLKALLVPLNPISQPVNTK